IIIFTEFLPGGDLRTLLNEAKAAGFMEEELQKSVIMDVVAGMKYIHANDVIHGDLKAKNILMDSHGRAKVAGFGLSNVVTVLSTGTSVLHMVEGGTTGWTAPEVFEESTSYRASDVYR
ncbi:unnamed protein product, partial [Choristocarpus tenellus]